MQKRYQLETEPLSRISI